MANEVNNIPGTEINNLMLNESISNADSSFSVSHYEEKLSSSMKILLMFNKELSYMKKKNEENEIENTRLKLHIQHLEKILSEHVAGFNKDKIDVCKNVNISPTSSSEIPRNCDTLVEEADNLCNNCMNQDPNGSTPEISLPSNSQATNNFCCNSFMLQNEISSNSSVNARKARKTFTKTKIIHSEKPLSSQQKPPKQSFHFHEIKTEPQSPCKFNPIEISENCTNNITTSITTIKLKQEKKLVLDEFLVYDKTPQKNLENDIINNSSSLSKNSSVFPATSAFANKEDAWISNDNPLTYLDYNVPGKMDISTSCGDFEHQKESLSTEKNISYVKKTFEAGYKVVKDLVPSISSVQMQQTEAQNTSMDKKSSSLSGDSTEEIIDESENTGSETGWNSKKKQKRYKKNRISITAQTSESQQRQISSQCDLLIKKSCKENSINSKSSSIRQSFSEGNISTEAVVSESEGSENDTSAKPKRKRKRLIKRIASRKTLSNNEQMNSSVLRLLKSEIGESENGSSTETSVAASNQSKYVKTIADMMQKRKLKMKSNLIDLVNIKLVESSKLSYIEESDSSIQKPPRKRVKTLDSEQSNDIPFSIQERAFQNEISPDQDIHTEVNLNQDSNTKSNRNIVPKKKLRNHKKGGVNFSKNSDTESSRSIVPERKLRSQKKRRMNVNQDSDTKNNRSIVPEIKLSQKKRGVNISKGLKTENNKSILSERKVRSHKERGDNVNQDSDTVNNRSILTRGKLRSHMKGEVNVKLDSNSEIDTSIVPKRKPRSHKKGDALLCVSNCIVSRSIENSSSSEETCSPIRNSLRKKMQTIEYDSSAEVEEHIALKPMQIPSLYNSQISETFSTEQEFSTKRTFMSKEKTPDLNQISSKCSTSLEEIKRLDSENSANENIREISEKCPYKLQEYDNLKPISLACTKEISHQDRIHIEANFKEIPLLKCFVLLKRIASPLEIENGEPINDNHLSIPSSEDAVSSLKEKIKFPVSSALATNQGPEHEIETDQPITSTLKDAINFTKENFEEDLSFDTDDTPDINSDNISPESIYEDSDCDPDWCMDEASFQEPSEFSLKKNEKGISLHENCSSDHVPLRKRNIRNTAKKSGHLSTKESTKNQKVTIIKNLKVKFGAPKKKKLNRRVENKQESELEKHMNSAIKEDLTRKNETRNKYEKLFWDTDADSDSSSELIVDKANNKHLAENSDLNNSAETVTTEDQVCNLKMKDAFSAVSGGCVKEGEILKNQESDHSLNITKMGAVKNCKNNAKKQTEIESFDSDFDFDAELIADEINCEALVLPKNLITNNHQKVLLVEDRIFGTDSSLNNEENMTTKEWKNDDEDNSACLDKTVLKNNDSNNDTHSDFDPELIDEIICEELQLPEHLILKDPQKNKQVEDRIVRSDDGVKNTERCKDLTVEEDYTNCYSETMHKKNENCNDTSDSDIRTELSICDRNCEELQLLENLIENVHQNILPIEDKVIGSPCSLTNISMERTKKVAEESPICHDKTVCKINTFYRDRKDSDINSELIGNGQNCEELQLPENDSEEFILIIDEISGPIFNLEDTITEKCEKVITEEGNSTSNEKIVHKINKICSININSDIDSELIEKEPNREDLNLPLSDHQKNMSVTDTMLKFTKDNEMLSSKENDTFCKTESDLLQTPPSCNSTKNIRNATSETRGNISVAEKSPICHDKAVCKINKFYSDSKDSDINSELIGNGQNCEELQLPENDSEEFVPVEDEISGSICSLENVITDKCEKVIIEEGNSTDNDEIVHKINKICTSNSNSDFDAKSMRKEPNFEELNLPGSVQQKNMSVTDRIWKFTGENERSSKENDAFYKTESDLLQIVKNIGNATSETPESISIISEKEEFSVKTAGKEEENYSVSDIITSNKTGLIIDEADNDELMQDCVECDLMNSLPVDYKENTSEKEALVSEIELKPLKEQKSDSCVQSMEDIVSEKNNTFVEHKTEVSAHNNLAIKNIENYNPDIDHLSDYAAQLVSEPVKAKNYEILNEEDSNSYGSCQLQICENENSQTEFLEGSFDYLSKSTEKLLQTNVQNDIIPNLSTKLNPNQSSSLSKINRYADQMSKANENQFCTKAVFPISHPKCVSDALNISKIETRIDIGRKKLLYQVPTSRKSCVVSVNEKSVTSFKKSQHKGNLPISLPETSKAIITKTAGRRSENFPKHRHTQRYFKYKQHVKRKTFNEYLKYKNLKINPENPIKSILQGIDVKQNFYTQLKPHTSLFVASVRFNHCVKSLVYYLMNPDKTPDITYLIFLVIKYLHHTRQNPLENFSKNQKSVFIPATENCVVTALFEIEKKSRRGYQKLLETILNVMHQFILAKNKMHIYGLASLCRVLTEICKRKNDKLKPLHLCCDLLKEKLKFASLLIISVAKVWKELFWSSDNLLEEENTLQISIAYGITKSVKSSAIVSMYCSLEAVSEYFDISRNESNINKVIEVLKNEILERSTQNSLKNSWKLTSPFVIFASFETWESTKKHLIDDYIIPNLQWFSHHVANEEAFDLFCNLYVDVLLLFPEHNPDELLMKFFRTSSACKGYSFIQDCSAVALIKHFILSKRNMPLLLTTWQEKNQTKPKVKALKILLQRRLMSDTATTFSKDEIIITSK